MYDKKCIKHAHVKRKKHTKRHANIEMLTYNERIIYTHIKSKKYTKTNVNIEIIT